MSKKDRTWVTEIGYPPADKGPLQVLRSPAAKAEPEAEPEMEIEP